jgi:hypothetical protein
VVIPVVDPPFSCFEHWTELGGQISFLRFDFAWSLEPPAQVPDSGNARRFSNYFDLKWLREAELKHGRICMLGCLGFITQVGRCGQRSADCERCYCTLMHAVTHRYQHSFYRVDGGVDEG